MGDGRFMRTVAFLTQKGGAGKTTLAASLAVAAAHVGETVIVLDLDPQASLLRWGRYREATNAPNKVIIEPLESERLPHLRAILEGLAGVGFTLAIFDTAGSDSAAARFVTEAADICLLPTRPTRLDVDVTAATFRAVFLAKRKAAFVLNQCPRDISQFADERSGKRPNGPRHSSRPDGVGACRFSGRDSQRSRCHRIRWTGRAAQEIKALWSWTRAQLERAPSKTLAYDHPYQQAVA